MAAIDTGNTHTGLPAQALPSWRRAVLKVGSNLLAADGGGLTPRHAEALAGFVAASHAEGREVVLVSSGAVNALLARSALLALPGTLVVIGLYHRWSSVKALVLFLALTAAALLLFMVLGMLQVHSAAAMVTATALLLFSSSGVIAMLIPYAAEIYPVHLRGTGSGVIAASSKAGGILGAGFGVLGVFGHFALSALV
ncbi:MAG: hypothetical protein WBG22_01295, partial [Rhodanobacter sp.]